MRKGQGRGRSAAKPLLPVRGKRRTPRQDEETVMRVGDADMLELVGLEPTDPGADGEVRERKPGQELQAVMAERDGYLDLARRERADFDNYRKRIEREMGQIKRESLAAFLRELIVPLDDMDRVLAESAKSESFESLQTGVRLMQENFWRTLAKTGVRRIEAKGKPFDPAQHEALTALPSADAAPNTVLEVYECG
ncbi:MAG: nucleotide exchange factor GrpE, partial [Planctomycetota bacterium]|nr:nucleotide exchange factor GrpE [Planctomycetota bacterium]